ncbi:hypothetical protein PVAND_011061 [Polypedilum vanderplanki]|uniref:Uncharacterized protein n=1 Tax=Polypedilum vanderplanki TaxID=319348 RepID=A0A9J6CJ99_POLVA|nr:hypothetical protein PVAND_011061 [Polypedilum vanderplanki]
MSLKVCGFNFNKIEKSGDEVISEFKEMPLKFISNDFLLKAHSYYEIQIYNDLKKFVINSNLKESINTTIVFTETILNVQLNDEYCFLLHESGKISKYNISTQEFITLDTPLNHNFERLIYISCRFQTLMGVSNSNCVYQLFPEFKLIYKFLKHQRVKKISSGLEHTIILTNNGDVFSFGCGLRGQLGHGDVASQKVPKLIEAISGIKIVDIACGAFHSCLVSSFGDFYSFGWNSCGQLGIRKDTEKEVANKYQQVFSLPQLIDIDDETDAIKNVYCGNKFTLLRTEANRLFSTGSNKFGQLAVGDIIDRNSFIEIPIKDINNETKIFCGYWSITKF